MKKPDTPLARQAYAYLERGRYAEANGCYEDAILYFEESLAIAESPEGWHCLGKVHGILGEFEAANAACLKAAQLAPHSAAPRITLAMNLIELQQYAEAEAWLMQARACPHHQSPGLAEENLGRLYEALGQIGEALNWFDAALANDGTLTTAKSGQVRLRRYFN